MDMAKMMAGMGGMGGMGGGGGMVGHPLTSRQQPPLKRESPITQSALRDRRHLL